MTVKGMVRGEISWVKVPGNGSMLSRRQIQKGTVEMISWETKLLASTEGDLVK